MEAFGHQKAMQFLLSTGLIITAFISDRHATMGERGVSKNAQDNGKTSNQAFLRFMAYWKK